MQANPTDQKKPNRLINEKSPYLLQHAYNPVDWYPWSQEAFNRAQAENKPIFLSIGYSTCHWCHVMEKESFEDPEVAKLMNEAFVCIKVDREERPDLDAAYMAVCQAMGRSCGWPLNVILTPKLSPFFVASYIPKTNRYNTLGMTDLIPQIRGIWEQRKADLEAVGADIKSRIETFEKRVEAKVDTQVLHDAYDRLAAEFDEKNGGFGFAPKFPRGHLLMFLLRYWKRSSEKHALEMAEKTLRQMRLGGVFDQIGFGFHRYSTDAQWLVPHFEKMLYDQAMLAMAYTEAYQATGAPKFRLSAKETLEYVLRDLLSPQGGFCSAEDADSEGQEGKFYFWTLQEIVDTLQPADADLATQLFNISLEGNYTEGGKSSGKNILHLPTPLQEIAQNKGLTLDELIMRLGSIRNLLFEARNLRVHPTKDDKVLTDWNGLMIAALAKAGVALDEQRYIEAARQAADFLLTHMQQDDGTLYHRFAKGERAIEGMLDDYAFLMFGLIELYEATFEDRYLQAAAKLTQIMNSKFWDNQSGGFFLAEKSEAAIPRIKQVYDGAMPSGNSVAFLDLLRLGRLLGNPELESKAFKLMRTFAEEVEAAPNAYCFLLIGMEVMFGPTYSVVIVGDIHDKETKNMLAALRKPYLPNLVVSVKQADQAGAGYQKLDGKPTAYVCQNQTCMPPTNQTEKMLELLGIR